MSKKQERAEEPTTQLSSNIGVNAEDYPKPDEQAAPGSTEALDRHIRNTNSTAVKTLEDDDAAGFEGMTQEDFNIPFIVILQKGSPQVDEDSGSQIEGAKAGMFYNTVTGELYDGKLGLRFVPCHRDHLFVEWVPRDEGGGFVGIHKPEDPKVVALRAEQGKFTKLEMKSGDGEDHDLVETFYVYGINVKEDGSHEYGVLSFSSSQIKAYKNWMTTARNQTVMEGNRRITVPLFGHVYRVTTIPQENKKGSWQGFRVTFDGKTAADARLPKESELYQAGKAFRDLAVSGVVKAANDTMTNADPSQGDSEEM
jgi:hypothetical protein